MSTHVRIVGAGLIGTSLGIALSNNGFRVSLADPSPTAVRLARDLRAGEMAEDVSDAPDVVVVAAPPDVAARVVVEALGRWPDAVVTDVASVKESVLRVVLDSGADASRYVGSHPMAGRERSGAAAARADLFDGRAWVVVPHEASTEAAVRRVRDLAIAVGSAVRVMPAHEHDEAVAAVSHVPQARGEHRRGVPARACPSPPSVSPGRVCATSPASRRATHGSGPRSSPATQRPSATSCATSATRSTTSSGPSTRSWTPTAPGRSAP